jgi:hypothetical protein
MTLAYYYILSSLPMLRKEGPPPITSDYFLHSCSEMVSAKTVEKLMGLKLIPKKETGMGHSSSAVKWYQWETDMRIRLAKFRAVSLGREQKSSQVTGASDIDRSIEEILSVPNPAEREKMLDNLRWKALEDLEFGHNFDFDSLCIYKIKLMLLEKWVGKDQGKGLENLNAILNKIEKPEITVSR